MDPVAGFPIVSRSTCEDNRVGTPPYAVDTHRPEPSGCVEPVDGED